MNAFEQSRQQYIINLLSEILPENLKNETQLSQIGLHESGTYIVLQLTMTNGITRLIGCMPETSLTTWKNIFHQHLLNAFTYLDIEPVCLLNLQPFNRTLILSVTPSLPHSNMIQQLQTCFDDMHEVLSTTYNASVIGCFGNFVHNFFDIGSSYKKSRKLQEYTFIIGQGKCIFFEDFSIHDDYSLIEYSYIQNFETLLQHRDWLNIYKLIDTIKWSLLTNATNNSKTTYLYKEIYALTIRHLFNEMHTYQDEIRQLNEGIIMFEHLFNDLHDVHAYYLRILQTISQVDKNTPYSLHIKKALHIIHMEYMQAISLNYIADSLNISTAYLSRLFKNEVGMNFKIYLTNYRMSVAKQLLKGTNNNLLTIGSNIGYPTATQFIRVFKSSEGITPTEYRNYHHN
ncbi:helix-turn-helix transcriptional regulator [Petrocella sp. FN5]|uniref:helix-turn-helix transcriptional regulator n=1 Tax=Petrocella sp. FN5 TaxID=3032002 RepID=UPI0023DAD93B|nr:AraC family transcriptional regulator [Petrocella sp. FN5]MDF1617595.1 AraC family transcriptional regulator [Petrocella sp. FN5]